MSADHLRDTVFNGFEKHIEIIEAGIFKDTRQSFGQGQEREYCVREQGASKFMRNPDEVMTTKNKYYSVGVRELRSKTVIQQLESKGDHKTRVLIDLGCGMGWQWVNLANKHPSITFLLVDQSINNLMICRSLMPIERYPNVICLQGDIIHLPVRESFSDFCWSVQVLNYMPFQKREEAYTEIKRVQKPGAACYIALIQYSPILKLRHKLFGGGEGWENQDGVLRQLFDKKMESELKKQFKDSKISYSETLFHPEFGLAIQNKYLSHLDILLGETLIGSYIAKQAEFWAIC